MFSTIAWHNKSALSIVAVDNNIIDILMVTWYDDKDYDFIENLGYTDALKFNSSYMPDGKKSFFSTEEGRATPIKEGDNTRWHFEYNLKDHFVNTRVVFGGSMIPGGVDIVQTSSYYPFEMVMAQKQYNTASANYQQNKYLYNGKELQDDDLGGVSLDCYDYGARFYDPSLGRFHTLDPLAENYYFQNPFAYAANNPIRYIDVLGMGPGDKVMPSPAGIIYEAYLAADAAVFNFMARGVELLGYGKEGINIRKETQYGDDGSILGNEIVENPEGSALQEGLEIVGDALSLIPSGSSAKSGILMAKTPGVKNQIGKSLKGAAKGSLSGTKKALKQAKEKLGLGDESLPKGKQGRMGSPQRGNSKKGYRLDPSHPKAKPGSGEEFPHINIWDYSNGKRGKGGIEEAFPINN